MTIGLLCRMICKRAAWQNLLRRRRSDEERKGRLFCSQFRLPKESLQPSNRCHLDPNSPGRSTSRASGQAWWRRSDQKARSKQLDSHLPRWWLKALTNSKEDLCKSCMLLSLSPTRLTSHLDSPSPPSVRSARAFYRTQSMQQRPQCQLYSQL